MSNANEKEMFFDGSGEASAPDEAREALGLERVAREMGIASPGGAAGLAFWMGPGMRLRKAAMDFSLALHEARGYQQVKSPSLAPLELFERSGHAEKYASLMYAAQGQGPEGALMLRPMSCPNHLSMYSERRRSVAELPWRVFEFGEVFRNEPSGSLAFLLRQRQFCQDDGHAVCALGQVGELAQGWLEMALAACEWMGCGEPELRLASRPAARMGSDESWGLCERLLAERLEASGRAWSWAPGEGAFYGPKIEFALRDGRGRSWQLGVFQLDLNLPERFGLQADGLRPEDGPLALAHHAVFGSVERAVGVMLACRGKGLPAWAHPSALAVIPVSAKHAGAAEAFAREARAILGSRCALLEGDAPLGAKIARAKEAGWLRLAVVGAQEEALGAIPGAGPVARVDGKAASAKEACSGLQAVA